MAERLRVPYDIYILYESATVHIPALIMLEAMKFRRPFKGRPPNDPRAEREKLIKAAEFERDRKRKSITTAVVNAAEIERDRKRKSMTTAMVKHGKRYNEIAFTLGISEAAAREIVVGLGLETPRLVRDYENRKAQRRAERMTRRMIRNEMPNGATVRGRY
jgi:hypothetical protein